MDRRIGGYADVCVDELMEGCMDGSYGLDAGAQGAEIRMGGRARNALHVYGAPYKGTGGTPSPTISLQLYNCTGKTIVKVQL